MVWSSNLTNWVQTWIGPQVQASGPVYLQTEPFCKVWVQSRAEPEPMNPNLELTVLTGCFILMKKQQKSEKKTPTFVVLTHKCINTYSHHDSYTCSQAEAYKCMTTAIVINQFSNQTLLQ